MNLATKVLNKPIGSYVATLPFIDIKKYFYSEYETQDDEDMIGLQNGDFVEIDAGRIALNFTVKSVKIREHLCLQIDCMLLLLMRILLVLTLSCSVLYVKLKFKFGFYLKLRTCLLKSQK